MGFNGVVVTDAMNMAGIAATYDEVQAVKLAINAGGRFNLYANKYYLFRRYV